MLFQTQQDVFQPKQSCFDALLHLSKVMRKMCERKELGFSFFVGFEKTFDTVIMKF